MDIATKCQTHSKGLHYGREHIEREIYNEKGFSIGAELFEEIVMTFAVSEKGESNVREPNHANESEDR